MRLSKSTRYSLSQLINIWRTEIWAALRAEWAEKFGNANGNGESSREIAEDSSSSSSSPVPEMRSHVATGDNPSRRNGTKRSRLNEDRDRRHDSDRTSPPKRTGAHKPYRTKAEFFLFGIKEKPQGICCICLEDNDEDSESCGSDASIGSDSPPDHQCVEILKCGHEAGKSCLFNWSRGNNICPSSSTKLFEARRPSEAIRAPESVSEEPNVEIDMST